MMRYLFSIVLAGVITLLSGLLAPAWATSLMPSSQPMAVLPGLQGVFTGVLPDNMGLNNGQLAPCPPSPNCVVSQTADADHTIAPIAYKTNRDTARTTLLKVLTVVPRTEIMEQTDDYIRIESTSSLMGFVDDGEFYFPADESVIHMRSAARVGESDLGVNRRRLEQIRLAMQELQA